MQGLSERFALSLHALGVKMEDVILAAVSGGLDSMVMLHLLYRFGYKCHVVHCNFGLRGEDSDADEELVKNTAAHYRYPFYVKRFPALEYSKDKSISVQMAARELRYNWFNELAAESGIRFIVTAHHADDVAETVLLNLVRGTGISGMKGIPRVNERCIRPLLFAVRAELETYANKQRLNWRNDASNEENYYRRNRIRNQVIPLLKEINPSVNITITRHAQIMEGYEKILEHYLDGLKPGLVNEFYEGSILTVSIAKLMETAAPSTILFHLLRSFGINSQICNDIFSAGTGAEFSFNGFRLIRDRNELTLFSPDITDDVEYSITSNQGSWELKHGSLTLESSGRQAGNNFETLPDFGNKSVAYLDASSLKFPLKVRRWQVGDRFQPLGMNGSRLLSDFFTDEKFSSAMKEVVYLLLSENQVVWVAGHRIGEPFRMHHDTTNMARFTFRSNL